MATALAPKLTRHQNQIVEHVRTYLRRADNHDVDVHEQMKIRRMLRLGVRDLLPIVEAFTTMSI